MLTHQYVHNEIKPVRPICKDMKKPPFHNGSLPTLLTEKLGTEFPPTSKENETYRSEYQPSHHTDRPLANRDVRALRLRQLPLDWYRNSYRISLAYV